MQHPAPQQELLDNLYELQSVRERGGVNPDFALIGDEPAANCTYLVDYATCTKEVDDRGVTQKLVYDGTRLVLTNLPLEQDEFSGARLAISAKPGGIELPDGTVSDYTVFIIGRTLTVQCFSLDGWSSTDFTSDVMDFESEKLTDMISVPRAIYPFPATQEDDRRIPENLESLIDPQNQTYTLGAGFFDREVSKNGRPSADRVGIKNIGTDKDPYYIYYRVRIAEDVDGFNFRESKFDRELQAVIDFSEAISLEVLGMGEELPRFVSQRSIRIKSTRESIYLYCRGERNDTVLYKVTDKSQKIIDAILAQSDNNQATS